MDILLLVLEILNMLDNYE